MPSPFPGMDPWLESPHIWPGFHLKLINETVAVLQPQLRSRGYYADSEERNWLREPRRPVYPDNVIFQKSTTGSLQPAAIALLEADEPVRIRRANEEVRESFVEIFDATGHLLVTGIEYLSPTNKLDAQGRQLYEQKQQELADAGIHLVEVDLLRRGRHLLDVPESLVDEFKPWDYLVNLVRRNTREHEFYPIRLRTRLPRIRIPLKTGEDDAVLDLQEVFERCYEIGPYPDRLKYSAPPDPPLSPDDAAWAEDVLKQRGLR